MTISGKLCRYQLCIKPKSDGARRTRRYSSPIVIGDYNQRAIAALRHAQALSGVRSATSFARLLAERAGGSPSPSAYRRWITGEAVVPAWALGLAADVVGVTIHELLDGAVGTETPTSSWQVEMTEAIGRLEAELIEVRQHVGLPWRHDDATARDDDARRERARPAS